MRVLDLGTAKGRAMFSAVTFACSFAAKAVMQVIARNVFLYYLGVTVLGLNATLVELLVMFNFVDAGIGIAMNHALYAPLVKKQTERVKALYMLYRKIYLVIGVGIMVLAGVLVPFLPLILKDNINLPHVYLIYALAVTNVVVGYFLRGKRPILNADQKQYIFGIYNTVFAVATPALQMLMLVVWQSLVGYLLVSIAMGALSHLLLMRRAQKMYGYLDEVRAESLPAAFIRKVKRNAMGAAIIKFKDVIVAGTDSTLIALFFTLRDVGIYSNYLLIFASIKAAIVAMTMGITAGVGHAGVGKDATGRRRMFIKLQGMLLAIAVVAATGFYLLIDWFITVWLGAEYLMGGGIVLLMSVLLFVSIVNRASEIFIASFGLYDRQKWMGVVEAGLNIVLSVVFARAMGMGIAGIVLGTLVSNLATNAWYGPWLVWRNILRVETD